MSCRTLIDEYLAGPDLLRQATRGLSAEQLRARPIAGQWSTLEVVCHVADFEIVYADRIKRVLAEHEPTLFGGNPDQFAARLAYHQRDLEEELAVVESVRRSVGRILRTLEERDFTRVGRHSVDGPLTLGTLLERITQHIPHHVQFIHQKRQALGLAE